ncbi:MAG: argininosuccinate lyase [Anaerolineae bacterium]|nr:argininosuccinate lyase [Anaerolineae bacterium]MCB0231056.1 argininosuccinate lyase [Anaerolineae bacterium]MCB0245505.1 argininosuccinate lyase [Anaerolineae bacterium]MCB0249240.1 argininosuccinate lyase [Anaerolineae bacterium]
MTNENNKTLWGGRFDEAANPLLRQFNDSLPFDRRLWLEDIFGSMAYAEGLARAGILTIEESDLLLAGLEQVAQEWRDGIAQIEPGDEDIHTAVERRLGELIGSVAGKLHTGRSRNDQIATDQRWWLRNQIDDLDRLLAELIDAATERAETEIDVLMPGYTHLQPAQPIRWSQWLLSHTWAWQRDRERLADLGRRANRSPLGAGALAGNPFAVDRHALAADLGFDKPIPNSIDAVRDRDYVVEFLSWAALLGVHLSQLAEDLILWSSREFGFVSVAEQFSTGSSIMPQKRNPDSLELLRGKSGRLTGNLVALLTTLKGMPAAYNKDLQEDKEPLFDSVDTLLIALPVATGVVQTLSINPQRMQAALGDELLATDLAEHLVRRGVPFRQSHELVGRAVKRAEALDIPLGKLPLAEFQTISPEFGVDVATVFDFEQSVERRDVYGGTSRRAVQEQISELRASL